MPVLLDTNILLRLLQPHHRHCALAERALSSLRKRDERLFVTAQNLVEFWCVITRPIDENGLGFTTEQAVAELDKVKQLFGLLPEMPLLHEWERLVSHYRVSGKNAHDVRLVASMIVHGVTNILTFNSRDFIRYSEIVVMDAMTLA